MPPAPSLNRRDFLQRSAALAATSLLASRLSPRLHAGEPAGAFRSSWDRARDRIWLGPEYWANPLQDWQVANQRIECVNAAADRNVHLLTRQLSSRPGTVELRVRIGRADGPTLAGKGSAGFRIGILGTLKDYPALHDYRNNLWPAPNAGFNAGFTAAGTLFLGRPDGPTAAPIDLARESLDLRLTITPKAGAYQATLTALDPTTATGKTAELFAGVTSKLGRVPNLMRTFGHSPATLEAYLGFSSTLSTGALSAKTREQIALAVAETNACDYCLAAHSRIGQGAGLTPEAILAARRVTATDPKSDALLKFAAAVVETRGLVSAHALDQPGLDPAVGVSCGGADVFGADAQGLARSPTQAVPGTIGWPSPPGLQRDGFQILTFWATLSP